MTREEILQVLMRWNNWGRGMAINTILRTTSEEANILINYQGVVVIKGPRRAGKSTLLYQVMDTLSAEREQRSLLYVNFEDYAFSSERLTPKMIEAIIDVYRQEIYPEGNFVLFLDEIQNVENWHRWVRTAIDSGLVKTIFVTGSSSKLLSAEFATLLSGRHVDIELLPFSFREYVNAEGYNPSDRIEVLSNSNLYLSLLKNYLTYGGFPEVVVDEKKEFLAYKILSQYAEDMILKDVTARYNIQNLRLLKALSKIIAQNVSNKLSIRKLQRELEEVFGEKSSTTTFSNYIDHLESAYFCFSVHKFDYSVKESTKSPAKYYLVDTGLRNAISPSFTSDRGRLLENAVYLKLRAIYEEIYYWEGRNEIDFVCRKENRLDLYNVAYASNEDEIKDRELKGFAEFPYRSNGNYLITWDLWKEISYNGVKIQCIPAHLFLLNMWKQD